MKFASKALVMVAEVVHAAPFRFRDRPAFRWPMAARTATFYPVVPVNIYEEIRR